MSDANSGCKQMGYLRLVLTEILLVLSFFPNVRCEERIKSLPTCKFPAIYNFGDSNSDTGGISAAFYPAGEPSGETFFRKPAGRGSDGRLIIDFIADHLGLPYLSAYLDTIGTSYRHGANFATGGSTIRPQNESMSAGGASPFSLDIQTVQFNQFKSRTTDLFSKAARKKIYRSRLPRPDEFAKALYTFDIGQNDIARGMQKLSHQQLLAAIPDINNQLATAIQNLYQLGARAFWIHNTGPIGCLPVTLHYYHHPPAGILDEDGCVKDQNEMAIEFNRQLKSKVVELRGLLPNVSLIYVDMYAAKFGLIGNANVQGFVDPSQICCGYHEDDKHIYCGHKGIVNGTEVYAGSCSDPSSYISWDGVHYTDAANHWLADRIVNGSFSDPPVPIKHACHAHKLRSQFSSDTNRRR